MLLSEFNAVTMLAHRRAVKAPEMNVLHENACFHGLTKGLALPVDKLSLSPLECVSMYIVHVQSELEEPK